MADYLKIERDRAMTIAMAKVIAEWWRSPGSWCENRPDTTQAVPDPETIDIPLVLVEDQPKLLKE